MFPVLISSNRILRQGVVFAAMSVTLLVSSVLVGADPAPEKVAEKGPSFTPGKMTVAGAGLLAEVSAPGEFEVTLFAAPPDISYPTCVCASIDGAVFVGVDLNGSLGRTPNQAKVVKCVDTNGDGKADKFTEFCKLNSPRGLVYDAGSLYVLHPPMMSVYRDADGDGVAESSQILLRGLGGGIEHPRGADHTTNGFQLGIDGWLYIAAGDYGFTNCQTSDGKSVMLYGGGVVRVRPDGTELELVSQGQRNIYDVAIDPRMNLFTRDNTNDGDGWNVRLSHVLPSANYGYPRLYKNFASEIVSPLADYGPGSPTGALYVHEPNFPAPYGDALFMVEWGKECIFRHPLTPKGATFQAEQSLFLKIPRPTDMDVDGAGKMYVASWRGGEFRFGKPDVGFLIRLQPRERTAPTESSCDKSTSERDLIARLASPGHRRRLDAQREILRRGPQPSLVSELKALAETKGELEHRIAALFTLAQIQGADSFPTLLALAKNDELREFALKALADRLPLAEKVPLDPFEAALTDAQPRVRAQAVIALGRLAKISAAKKLLPLTHDADPIVAHVAIQALVKLQASAVCLESLEKGAAEEIPGCVRVLQLMHTAEVTQGLMRVAQLPVDAARRQAAYSALARLYFREAAWKGNWWGTRPDSRGPYFGPETWEQSTAISASLKQGIEAGDAAQVFHILNELQRHRIPLTEAIPVAIKAAREQPAVMPNVVSLLLVHNQLPPEGVQLLASFAISEKGDSGLKARALRALRRPNTAEDFAAIALVYAQAPETGPLATVCDEFIRDGKHLAAADAFVKFASEGEPSRRELALAVLCHIASGKGNQHADKRRLASQAIDKAFVQRDQQAPLLRAIGRVRSDAYSLQIQALAKEASGDLKQLALATIQRLGLDEKPPTGPVIADLEPAKVIAEAVALKGDLKRGQLLFTRQGCVACHTTSPDEAPKGPPLGGIAQRYKRHELAESVLQPSAKIAQGFQTQFFQLDDGRVLEGFVTRDSGNEIELRNQNGAAEVLKKEAIERQGTREISVMPQGLLNRLAPADFASLLDYLESLPAK